MVISKGVIKKHGGRCYYCHRIVVQPKHAHQIDNMATIDHMIPLSRGGNKKRDSANCVLACYSCNNAKLDRTIQDLLKDGWRFGQKVKPKTPEFKAVFQDVARRRSASKVEHKSYWRSFSALHFALMNHVDILV